MSKLNSYLLYRILLVGFQAFCLLFVLSGLASIPPLITAIDAFVKGALPLPELCWKILSVTVLLIPAMGCIVIAALCFRFLRAPSYPPNEPWMANPMWAKKHIRLNNLGLFWGMAFSLLCFVGIAVPLAIATQKTAIQVAFGVIGLVLLVVANMFWRNRKWNTAELRMATVPGVIGGPFSGVAILQESFPAGTVFNVCLKCQLTSSFRNSKNSGGTSTKTETVWSSSIYIDKLLPPDRKDRTLIPFSFAIPFDCDPTTGYVTEKGSSILWNLVVTRKDKVDYGGAVFTIPVYRTSESSRDFEIDKELIAPFEHKPELDAVFERIGLSIETLPGNKKRILIGIWNSKVVLAIGVMLLFCAGCIFAAFWFLANRYVSIFLSIFPGIMLFSGIYTLLDMLLWKSSIEIDDDFVRCQSGWKGYERTFIADKKEGLTFLCEFDSNKQNGEWYRVDAFLPSRKKGAKFHEAETLTIVRQLDGQAEAQVIQSWLFEQTGIPAPTPAEES